MVELARQEAGVSSPRAALVAVSGVAEQFTPQTLSFPCRDQGLKRAVDYLASIICLVVLSPLFALVWLAVVSTSNGPALFTSPRVGRYGRTFMMPKFRTMFVGAKTC